MYAHIDNYTQVKGAWCGSQRDLAAQLELPIATVSNQITELITKGLIVREANMYRSADEQNHESINYINNMEIKENNAHANMRDAIPQNPSFLDLKKLFLLKGGKSADLNETKALEAWSQATPIKRRQLLEALQSRAHFKHNQAGEYHERKSPTNNGWFTYELPMFYEINTSTLLWKLSYLNDVSLLPAQ